MMAWDIIFSPLVSPYLLIGAALLSFILMSLLLFKKSPGALLRGVGLLMIITALANPSLRQEQRDPLGNVVLIVSDKSPSQIVAKREQLVDMAIAKLGSDIKKISNLEAEFVSIDGDEESAKDGTLLFAKLRDALSRVAANRLAGVVLVTDGQIHDAPQKLEALGIDVPVHSILTGDRGEFDRRIEIVKAPRFGIVGGTRMLSLKVVEHGGTLDPLQTIKLSILQKGQGIKTRIVRIGEEVKIPMGFPHAGNNLMEVEIESDPKELTSANNRAVISAEGIRENLRVLLVSGEPHAGERTWRNLLKSDAAVDLVHFTILRPPEKQDGTPIHQLSLIAFPTRELFSEKLDDFDLIIFDRYQRRGVLPLHYLDNVSQYVLNGGAVLIAAGDKFATPVSLSNTPLEQILPARPTGKIFEKPYKPKVSEKGKRHPVTQKLNKNGSDNPDWGRWFRLIGANVSEGEILMQGADEEPLLVLNRLGKGRIALLLSDHAWLWARGFEGGGPYTTLLRRLSHWLMREPDLEEESLNATGDGRSLKITRRSMKDVVDPVVVTRPDGSSEKITLTLKEPGLFENVQQDQQLGIHRVQSGKLDALAHIGFASKKEMANIVATETKLAPLIKDAKSGQFWTGRASEASQLKLPEVVMLNRSGRYFGQNWLALKDRNAYVVKGFKLIPLMSGLLALGAMLMMLGLMWWREGR